MRRKCTEQRAPRPILQLIGDAEVEVVESLPLPSFSVFTSMASRNVFLTGLENGTLVIRLFSLGESSEWRILSEEADCELNVW